MLQKRFGGCLNFYLLVSKVNLAHLCLYVVQSPLEQSYVFHRPLGKSLKYLPQLRGHARSFP